MVSTLGERFLVWPVPLFFFLRLAPGFGVFVAGHHQSAGWRPMSLPFAMLGFLDSLGEKNISWSVLWNMAGLFFAICWECHDPNWLIFFRGVGQPPTSIGLIDKSHPAWSEDVRIGWLLANPRWKLTITRAFLVGLPEFRYLPGMTAWTCNELTMAMDNPSFHHEKTL